MILVKILKRKDASSVIIAVVLAGIIGLLLQSTTGELATTIIGQKDNENFFGGFGPPGAGWMQVYLFPVVWALVQIVILEILAWIVVGVSMLASSATKSSRKK